MRLPLSCATPDPKIASTPLDPAVYRSVVGEDADSTYEGWAADQEWMMLQ